MSRAIRQSIAEWQQILKAEKPLFDFPPAPRIYVSPRIQSLFDSQCNSLIQRAAHDVLKCIKSGQLSSLSNFVDKLSSYIFFPLSPMALDRQDATAKMLACLGALEVHLKQNKFVEGSTEERSFLRVFALSHVLIVITSPGDVSKFLIRYLDRSQSESARLVHVHQR
jgi:hypothetical protein